MCEFVNVKEESILQFNLNIRSGHFLLHSFISFNGLRKERNLWFLFIVTSVRSVFATFTDKRARYIPLCVHLIQLNIDDKANMITAVPSNKSYFCAFFGLREKMRMKRRSEKKYFH